MQRSLLTALALAFPSCPLLVEEEEEEEEVEEEEEEGVEEALALCPSAAMCCCPSPMGWAPVASAQCAASVGAS